MESNEVMEVIQEMDESNKTVLEESALEKETNKQDDDIPKDLANTVNNMANDEAAEKNIAECFTVEMSDHKAELLYNPANDDPEVPSIENNSVVKMSDNVTKLSINEPDAVKDSELDTVVSEPVEKVCNSLACNTEESRPSEEVPTFSSAATDESAESSQISVVTQEPPTNSETSQNEVAVSLDKLDVENIPSEEQNDKCGEVDEVMLVSSPESSDCNALPDSLNNSTSQASNCSDIDKAKEKSTEVSQEPKIRLVETLTSDIKNVPSPDLEILSDIIVPEKEKSKSGSETCELRVTPLAPMLKDSSTEAESTDTDPNPMQSCSHCKKVIDRSLNLVGQKFCSKSCRPAWLYAKHKENLTLGRRCHECKGSLPLYGFLSWEAMDFCKDACLVLCQVSLPKNCHGCRRRVPQSKLGKFCTRIWEKLLQFCSSVCLRKYGEALKLCGYCKKGFQPEGCQKEGIFCSAICSAKFRRKNDDGDDTPQPCAVCGNIKPVVIDVQQDSKIQSLCSEPCFAAFKFVNNLNEDRCFHCSTYFEKESEENRLIFNEDNPVALCSAACLNSYLFNSRKSQMCGCCTVKKYNFDMIRKVTGDGIKITCSIPCLKAIEKKENPADNLPSNVSSLPQIRTVIVPEPYNKVRKISSNQSTQVTNGTKQTQERASSPPPAPKIYQHIITKPPEWKQGHNKAILCKPYMHNKGTSCRPMPCYKETQTDGKAGLSTIVPVPVPIYIPAPLGMYSLPYPVPIPFPLPIPVPIFIPTTRNSAKGIFKEIKKIQEKIPNDPYEAELLMMAEMVAGEKKQDPTDSESDGEDATEAADAGHTFSPEAVDSSNTFGEDIMQIALKMASELDEPQVDMESVLTSNTITPSAQPNVEGKAIYASSVSDETAHSIAMMRGRKRGMRGSSRGSTPSKRGRRSSGTEQSLSQMQNMGNLHPAEINQPSRIEIEKPDANMRLKYTFGVNAWRHWVMQKNQDLEKAMITNRKIKPFKPDLLQLTADELNFSLCLFVKEVKKPNGQEYAPDTIYYLCLGIQQYMFENGRIDNIFTDSYYEKFTDCLDEVAKKFTALYNDSQYIVTRVEEEHLWESKQLGAHSPHVLLSTLMFFNTKHFNLVTVEEHMQLSFSHIMKHWKRNPNAPGATKIPGSRNVLLRFYPPQSALEANSRKKKVYEQQENEENPLRCPVKLYEFYLSKCPESVKTRNDVFYLLPERSCVPDSPVWYSTMALGKEPLMKMLHRVKMVKEINVALLTS